MKKIYFFVFIGVFVIKLKAQFVVSDPTIAGQNSAMIANQVQMIQNGIKTMKEMKAIKEQAEASYQELNQMKSFLENAEERLSKVTNIKDLRINKLENVLERILCLKNGNHYYTAVKFQGIVNLMKNAFLACDNSQLYQSTFSGVAATIENKGKNAGKVGYKELSNRLGQLNVFLSTADKTNVVAHGHDKKMKLELAARYKAISEELMNLSHELHLAINQTGGEGYTVQATENERLQLMDRAMQYQMQSLEYEEKASKLMAEAAQPTEQDKAIIMAEKRNIFAKQLIHFRN